MIYCTSSRRQIFLFQVIRVSTRSGTKKKYLVCVDTSAIQFPLQLAVDDGKLVLGVGARRLCMSTNSLGYGVSYRLKNHLSFMLADVVKRALIVNKYDIFDAILISQWPFNIARKGGCSSDILW